jgi:hypothetical protein
MIEEQQLCAVLLKHAHCVCSQMHNRWPDTASGCVATRACITQHTLAKLVAMTFTL